MDDVPSLDTYKLQWQVEDLKRLIDTLEHDNRKLKTELESAYIQMRFMNSQEYPCLPPLQ